MSETNKKILPVYANMDDWEFYASDLMVEYKQSCEEGLDIEQYYELFQAVSHLPKNEMKKVWRHFIPNTYECSEKARLFLSRTF